MIIPSIDIMKGRAVQLEQGERLQIEVQDSLRLARDFARLGEVAVVDIDGAKGEGDNRELLAALCREAPCRIGGGIRSVEDALNRLRQGAVKIVIASAVFLDDGQVNLDLLRELCRRAGRERMIIAVDLRRGRVQTRGWRRGVPLSAQEAVRVLSPYCSEFLYTSVDHEGLMNGIDLDGVTALRGMTENRLVYAGGVSRLSEIESLTTRGIDVQLGMALYSGRLDLTEAFLDGLKWNADGLIPALAQDPQGRILMQAWCSPESLRKTLDTGWATYYSRSRRSLWCKGESSGNRQRFLGFRPDCDSDSLLMQVEPLGPACHTGQSSCFGPLSFGWQDLFRVVCERIENAPAGSYTASLNDRTVREKLMEEADEVCRAVTVPEVAWEVADLLYFATVIMARAGVRPDQVWQELQSRRWR